MPGSREATLENVTECLEEAGIAITTASDDDQPHFEGLDNRPPKRWFIVINSPLGLFEHADMLSNQLWPVFGRGVILFDGASTDEGSRFVLRPVRSE